ncbi:MAG TPA: glycosyltransferase [Bacteroidales bacterium]|nr:glycosyltransferase [Bacteroidales bacterium]
MNTLKKKIFWLTPDYFADVDAAVVPSLMKQYEIEWMIISPLNSQRKADGIIKDSDVRPMQFNLKRKQRDPRVIIQYIELLRQIRSSNPDLVYLSFSGLPYFFLFLFLYIKPGKIIYALHNVTTPEGAMNELVTRIFQKAYYKQLKRFHVFSEFQLQQIKKMLPDKKHYYAPLALKDYGKSNAVPPDNIIRFLFFGYILKYKRVDLLINAFQEVYDKGYRNIELVIAGSCDHWDTYKALIRNADAIRTRIEIIPNEDIPDLVSSCHYVVLPYQDGTQSGVIPVAYQYNKPVVATDIEAFRKFIIGGKTGYVFKKNSAASLSSTLEYAIRNHESNYPSLTENVLQFKSDEYSLTRILGMYHSILDECLNK